MIRMQIVITSYSIHYTKLYEPLAGLTGLKVLILTGCKAQDYAPLAKLVNLDFLMLDHATIADASPLASLTKLKHLYSYNFV